MRPASASGVLWVVATPIGNLEDVTLRALRVLAEAAFIACEDTRTTRKLLARHGISTRMVSCHEHNESRRALEIVASLERGENVALTTDAGTPGVSDPGRKVVAQVLAAGHRVEPVPGPSAVLAALVASGFAADRFHFVGFLPRKGVGRRSALAEALAMVGAVVLYEAPHRIARLLVELAALAPERRASIHREMTKIHEETRQGTLAELARDASKLLCRGEFTLVLEGAAAPVLTGAGDPDAATDEARRLVASGHSPSAAARQAAASSGVSRRQVYHRLIGRDEEE